MHAMDPWNYTGKSVLPASKRWHREMIAIVCLFVWLAIALGSSLFGLLGHFQSATLLAWGLALPGATYACTCWASQPFRRWVLKLALRLLTLGEAPRLLGGSFLLWKYWQGALPAAFALPTGISDIVVGATAIPVAFLLLSPLGRPKPGFLSWQILGFTWLIISSSSGIITSPTGLRLFPMNLVPVFLGPVMILLHLAAITITIWPQRTGTPRTDDPSGNG